ncbi:hypothetical protein JCM19232_1503 [Vibrio ishigakensis]|uniref:Uncharacterized protein n=1 Tax=Vibrio ishigakensis TaxID=1481914 RepID=A0A0B8PAF3_9VIBR|nr:hypothetical protein JCM19232_1503 [Vibrio ishigakensis]
MDNPNGASIGYYARCVKTGVISSVRIFWNKPPINSSSSELYQAGDTATHPEHQKKGLAKKLIKIAKEENDNLNYYNFPNEISKKAYISTGSLQKGYYVNEIKNFIFVEESSLSGYSLTLKENQDLLIDMVNVDSQEYFIWRFIDNPLRSYFVRFGDKNSFCIFIKDRKRGINELRIIYEQGNHNKQIMKGDNFLGGTLYLLTRPKFYHDDTFRLSFGRNINVLCNSIDINKIDISYADIDFI